MKFTALIALLGLAAGKRLHHHHHHHHNHDLVQAQGDVFYPFEKGMLGGAAYERVIPAPSKVKTKIPKSQLVNSLLMRPRLRPSPPRSSEPTRDSQVPTSRTTWTPTGPRPGDTSMSTEPEKSKSSNHHNS